MSGRSTGRAGRISLAVLALLLVPIAAAWLILRQAPSLWVIAHAWLETRF